MCLATRHAPTETRRTRTATTRRIARERRSVGSCGGHAFVPPSSPSKTVVFRDGAAVGVLVLNDGLNVGALDVGAADGRGVGGVDGPAVGAAVGSMLGKDVVGVEVVGGIVGAREGHAVGTLVGAQVGTELGAVVGGDVGAELGTDVGTPLGAGVKLGGGVGGDVGTDEGMPVGIDVGIDVGSGVDAHSTGTVKIQRTPRIIAKLRIDPFVQHPSTCSSVRAARKDVQRGAAAAVPRSVVASPRARAPSLSFDSKLTMTLATAAEAFEMCRDFKIPIL